MGAWDNGLKRIFMVTKFSIAMKYVCSLLTWVCCVVAARGAESRVGLLAGVDGDTMHVRPSDLDIKGLQTGNYNYLIVFQNALDSPAKGLTFVRMNVERGLYHQKPAITIRQQWDRDSVIHRSYTVFDAGSFATLLHDTYWSRLGYSMVFDFEARTVDSKTVLRRIPDSIRTGAEKELAGSFAAYNLNWHDDLVIYSMLPYKEGRTFMINYYDPGFGAPQEVAYTVSGSDWLVNRGGEKIDCWVLAHSEEGATEKYWISKKGHEVLKEEDHVLKSGLYRFKYKLGVAGGGPEI
jgi:hypothetical protein